VYYLFIFFIKLGVFLEQKIDSNLLVQQEVPMLFTARL